MERKMNTDTFEALREVGFDEKQAVVMATAIPDVEPPIERLRNEMDARFARQRVDSILIALALLAGMFAIAKDFWGLFS